MFGIKLKVSIVVVMVACAGAMGATTDGGLPADQAVRYLIHEVPGDASSTPVFLVTMFVKAVEMNGLDVGWEITKVRFEDLDTDVRPGPTWTKYAPELNTSDGLWWVTHVDPLNPALGEFDEAPYIEGYARKALAATSSNRLYFEFESYTYTGNVPPYVNTASSSALFQVEEEDEPEVEIDDDPVEINPDEPMCVGIVRAS